MQAKIKSQSGECFKLWLLCIDLHGHLSIHQTWLIPLIAHWTLDFVVHDSSSEAELIGSSRITCEEIMGKCSVVFSFLLKMLTLMLSMLLASSIMRQNSGNHYNNHKYLVKLPFIPKTQLIFKCQSSTEIHWENKCPTLVCVTENILAEKVLSS